MNYPLFAYIIARFIRNLNVSVTLIFILYLLLFVRSYHKLLIYGE